MKAIILLFITAAISLQACRSGENKTETEKINTDTAAQIKTDTIVTAPQTTTENANDNKPAEAKKSPVIKAKPNSNEILNNIDEHLVTSAQFTAGPSGGITNCVVSVKNTLTNVTFQKVYVAVIIKNDDGTAVNKNFYTVINIEPGMTKTVKVPNTTTGTKVATNIVKVKSEELTKGEWVLTGDHY